MEKGNQLTQVHLKEWLLNQRVCYYVVKCGAVFLGLLRRVDLIICPSVRPQKVFPIPMKFGV